MLEKYARLSGRKGNPFTLNVAKGKQVSAPLKAGFAATLPLWPGVAAFGLVYGLAARQVGLSAFQALLMSLTVYAGGAQFSALQIWGSSGAGVIVLVTLIVNLRYLILGGSLAPYLRERPWLQKALAAFMLSDESYAVAMAQFSAMGGSYAYLIGANLGIYVTWATASLGGALLQSSLPELSSYRLELIFPLAFLGMLMPLVRNRTAVMVALIAAGLSLAGAVWLPGKWYILIAGVIASLVGALLEGRWKR